jgi:carboxymethylenebutenolidase
MALESRTEVVSAHDGGRFDAYTVFPEGGPGPGIVVLQEIYGVGPYVRRAAERLAELGYVALAPDLYWRIEPNKVFEHTEEGTQQAIAFAERLDSGMAVNDAGAALGHVRALREVGHSAGVLGFCLGGSLAYMVAAQSDPDAVVCYYGSAISGALDQADLITCPTLFHFGGSDPFIPRGDIDRVKELVDTRPDMELHIQDDAGHAFDNHEAPMFHNPSAAEAAWGVTESFLKRTLRD